MRRMENGGDRYEAWSTLSGLASREVMRQGLSPETYWVTVAYAADRNPNAGEDHVVEYDPVTVV